ncbi:hypothetical protein FA95DRAFT_1563852, partial [Auriscalpium vulgare]
MKSWRTGGCKEGVGPGAIEQEGGGRELMVSDGPTRLDMNMLHPHYVCPSDAARYVSTFETSEMQKTSGVCVINSQQVQACVNAKYDATSRPLRREAREYEGHARVDHQSAQRPQAPLDRRAGARQRTEVQS